MSQVFSLTVFETDCQGVLFRILSNSNICIVYSLPDLNAGFKISPQSRHKLPNFSDSSIATPRGLVHSRKEREELTRSCGNFRVTMLHCSQNADVLAVAGAKTARDAKLRTKTETAIRHLLTRRQTLSNQPISVDN